MADAAPAPAPASDSEAASATAKPTKKKKQYWRPWLRAMHRDIGYVAVGLTFVYALSGLAVNHLTDWSDGDASFKTYSTSHELGPLKGEDQAIADDLRKRLAIKEVASHRTGLEALTALLGHDDDGVRAHVERIAPV